MATLILSTYRAKNAGGFIQISFELGGTRPPVLAGRRVEFAKTAEALALLDAYAEEAAATGEGALVSASLARGCRAPSGFRQAKLERYVNL
jgi:hypothetical protein